MRSVRDSATASFRHVSVRDNYVRPSPTLPLDDGGNHSRTSDGRVRTLRSLSKNASKMVGEPIFDLYSAYWGSLSYADDFVMGALNASGPFAGATPSQRIEYIQKGTAYQNVWMAVLHELHVATAGCGASDSISDGARVHAWDKAWAFYAGSLTKTAGYPDSGQLVYELANKRCQNYATCEKVGRGNAAVNEAILVQFEAGRDALAAGTCSEAVALFPSIVSHMTLPLVQGTMRYAYLADAKGGEGADIEIAEGWAFAAAVLPLVDRCNSTMAKFIYSNMWIGLLQPVPDGHEAVVKAFQSVYDCLGITCSGVGGLVGAYANDETDAVRSYHFDPCYDAPSKAPTMPLLESGSRSVMALLAGSLLVPLLTAVVVV